MTNKTKQRTRNVLRVFFILYMIALFYFLFFSERYGRTIRSTEYRYNLELFREIKRFIQYREVVGTESFMVNIAGNIIAFAPFGFFVPIIRKQREKRNRRGAAAKALRGAGTLFNVTLLSFELTLFIETTQLITRVGCFDVDDLFMNTVGGMLGCITYFICHAIIGRRG